MAASAAATRPTPPAERAALGYDDVLHDVGYGRRTLEHAIVQNGKILLNVMAASFVTFTPFFHREWPLWLFRNVGDCLFYFDCVQLC